MAALILVAGGIIGAVLASVGGGSSKSARPSVGSSARPRVLPVTDLAADAKPFVVTLTWTPASGGSAVEGYTVYRNGNSLGNIVRGLRSFTDKYAFPEKRYTYEVVARGTGGLESPRVSVSVKVPIPPIRAARVQGDFNVKLKLVGQTGFQDIPPNSTEAWFFKPKCDTGPCPVVWTDLTEKGFKATLRRAGAEYSGSDSGRYGSCSGVVGTATLTVEFRVVKARAFNGNWVATKLVGTLRETSAEQLGCVSSNATFTFVANLPL